MKDLKSILGELYASTIELSRKIRQLYKDEDIPKSFKEAWLEAMVKDVVMLQGEIHSALIAYSYGEIEDILKKKT